MAKLPPDFVKAPVFDQPYRATAPSAPPPPVDDGKRDLVLRIPEALYRLLEKASAAEGLTPMQLVERILVEWGTPARVVAEPRLATPKTEPRAAPSGLVAQVIELFGSKLKSLPLLRRFALFVDLAPASAR